MMNDEILDVFHGAFKDELEAMAMKVKANSGKFRKDEDIRRAKCCLKGVKEIMEIRSMESRMSGGSMR